MPAFYNEHDPKAAAWLRELIARNLIAPGVVDERSIVDIRPADLAGFTQVHCFAGIGTWSYALRQSGWADSRSVWTGSPPCQPFSTAGKQLGADDERHLAPAFLRLVRECRPSTVFGEQVASAATGSHGWWLDSLFDELEREKYACWATIAGAGSVGAPHIRQRLYFVAQSEGAGRCGGLTLGEGGRTESGGPGAGDGAGPLYGFWRDAEWLPCRDGKWRPTGPGISPLVVGNAKKLHGAGCGDHGGSGGEVAPSLPEPGDSDSAELRKGRGGRLSEPRPLALADGSAPAVVRGGDCGAPGVAKAGWSSPKQGDAKGTYRGRFGPDGSIEKNRSQMLQDQVTLVGASRTGWATPQASDPIEGRRTDLDSPQKCFGRDIKQAFFTPHPEDANNTAEARVMRLKGYGNGIVAPLAQMFIECFMDVERG